MAIAMPKAPNSAAIQRRRLQAAGKPADKLAGPVHPAFLARCWFVRHDAPTTAA